MLIKLLLAATAILSLTTLAVMLVNDRPASNESSSSGARPAVVDDLNRLKLEREVRNLQWEPWLGILPTAIALIALFTAWSAGLFEARTLRLEASRDRLQMEISGFQEERQRLERDNEILRKEAESLRAENQSLEHARLEAMDKLAAAPLEALVHELGVETNPYNFYMEPLIARLKTASTQSVEELSKRVSGSEARRKRASIALALALAFPDDSKYRDQFLELIAKEAKAPTTDHDLLLGVGDDRWPRSIRFALCRRVGEMMRESQSTEVLSLFALGIAQLQAKFPAPGGGPPFLLHRHDPKLFAEVLSTAIEIALDRSASRGSRENSLAAIVGLSPVALLVTLGRIAQRDDTAEREFSELRFTVTRAVRQANAIVGGSTRGPDTDDGGPHLDPYTAFQWKEWASKHQELMALWSEPGLPQIVARPELVEERFSRSSLKNR